MKTLQEFYLENNECRFIQKKYVHPVDTSPFSFLGVNQSTNPLSLSIAEDTHQVVKVISLKPFSLGLRLRQKFCFSAHYIPKESSSEIIFSFDPPVSSLSSCRVTHSFVTRFSKCSIAFFFMPQPRLRQEKDTEFS